MISSTISKNYCNIFDFVSYTLQFHPQTENLAQPLLVIV